MASSSSDVLAIGSAVSSAIIGANRPEQIEQNVGAVGVELDSATCKEIDEVLDGVVRR